MYLISTVIEKENEEAYSANKDDTPRVYRRKNVAYNHGQPSEKNSHINKLSPATRHLLFEIKSADSVSIFFICR